MKFYHILLATCLLLILDSCSPDSINNEDIIKIEEIPSSIPLQAILLSDLSEFKSSGTNWSVVGDVYTDFGNGESFELEAGVGILANKRGEERNLPLYSSFSHGDIELEFEYLIPKGSNSGIYFQERYELQLFDSYGAGKPKIGDSGSIYERWDDKRPEGKQGYEGSPAYVNSSKAPGLWQKMKVYFEAPKFSEEGEKLSNAKFRHVYHNGVLVQENEEVSGPTRGGKEGIETSSAPFYIQGDHGNIAFRNIKYKAYTEDSLVLRDLTYQYFEHYHNINFPVFDTVKILKEGEAELLDPNVANEKGDAFGLIFKGTLDVPIGGEYLFHTGIDDGADLLIDGELIIHNDGYPGYDDEYGFTILTEGEHAFELRYYDNVWNERILVGYEGPGMKKRFLKRKEVKSNWTPPDPLLMDEVSETELIRSFAMYDGRKRTHVINVGSPSKAHYTYDLQEGSLLRFWKGGFADVTNMWQQRGEPQTLVPLNAEIKGMAGSPFKEVALDEITFVGYELAENGEPTFEFRAGQFAWKDAISPSKDGTYLTRTLTYENGSKPLTWNIAKGKGIKLLPNGYYTIDGQYYLKMEGEKSDASSITKTMNPSESFTYQIYW